MNPEIKNIPVPSAETSSPKPKKVKEKKIRPILRVAHDPHLGRWCFDVETSESAANKNSNWRMDSYKVDLEANRLVTSGMIIYNGECNCPNFEFKRQPDIRKFGRVSRCPHIKAAIYSLSNELVSRTIEAGRRKKSLFNFFNL